MIRITRVTRIMYNYHKDFSKVMNENETHCKLHSCRKTIPCVSCILCGFDCKLHTMRWDFKRIYGISYKFMNLWCFLFYQKMCTLFQKMYFCVCVSCILCGFDCKLHTMRFMRLGFLFWSAVVILKEFMALVTSLWIYGVFFSTKKCALYFKKCIFMFVS